MSLSVWFGNGADKEKTKRDLVTARPALDRLEEILRSKMKETNRVDDYSNPNWGFLMADYNGYNRAIAEVLKIIKGD